MWLFCAAVLNRNKIFCHCYGSGSRPVTTGSIWRQCPPNIFCPTKLCCAQNILFKRIIKTKVFPPNLKPGCRPGWKSHARWAQLSTWQPKHGVIDVATGLLHLIQWVNSRFTSKCYICSALKKKQHRIWSVEQLLSHSKKKFQLKQRLRTNETWREFLI